MMTLRDGPAAGTYMVRRAPQWLRAVVSASGVKDVLDQLHDAPKADERISVYRIVRNDGWVHLNRGRRGSGIFVMAQYVHMPEVDGEMVRTTEAWREWATGQADVSAYPDAEPQQSTGEPE